MGGRWGESYRRVGVSAGRRGGKNRVGGSACRRIGVGGDSDRRAGSTIRLRF
jgi:hypothetical protein